MFHYNFGIIVFVHTYAKRRRRPGTHRSERMEKKGSEQGRKEHGSRADQGPSRAVEPRMMMISTSMYTFKNFGKNIRHPS